MSQKKQAEVPLPSLDLRSRAFWVATQLVEALKAGRLPVAPAARQSVASELEQIAKMLRAPSADAFNPPASILPAAWLEARWRAVMQANDPWPQELRQGDLGSWYPVYEDRAVSANERGLMMNYRRRVDRGDMFSIGGPMVLYSLDMSLGRRPDPSTVPAGDLEGCDARVSMRPDPTLNFTLVRQGRIATLTRALAGDLNSALRSSRFATNQRFELFNFVGPKLLVEDDRRRVVIDVSFDRQLGQNTTVAKLGSVQGVSPTQAAFLVHLQRLPVLIAGLVYGRKMDEMNPWALPYSEIQRALQERGMADRNEQEMGERWQSLVARVGARLGKEKTSPVSAPEGLAGQATAVKGGLLGGSHLLVAVESLSAQNMRPLMHLLMSQKGAKWVLLGRTDGRTLRELLRDMPQGGECGVLLAETGAYTAPTMSAEQLEHLGVDTKDHWAPPVPLSEAIASHTGRKPFSTDDLPLYAAPAMGLLDPMQSLAWLALASLGRSSG